MMIVHVRDTVAIHIGAMILKIGSLVKLCVCPMVDVVVGRAVMIVPVVLREGGSGRHQSKRKGRRTANYKVLHGWPLQTNIVSTN